MLRECGCSDVVTSFHVFYGIGLTELFVQYRIVRAVDFDCADPGQPDIVEGVVKGALRERIKVAREG